MFAAKTQRAKVCVGLSGGVDSAVSAALLKEQGYEVVGAFIRITLPGYPCSAGQDKLEAMRVAAHLRLPFVEIDLSKEYQKRVFELSMGEFERGRTPNPDALCNREIKFGLFYDWCMAQGADYVATGHYARLAKPTDSGYAFFSADKNAEVLAPSRSKPPTSVVLLSGKDEHKDQSYFLWAVPAEKLQRTLFPIGHLRKPEVRALAAKLKLPNFDRPDSQGLCFLGDVSIEDMLHQELTLVPGDVLNEAGEVVGRHEGVPAYTLGQRHGFTLFAKTPDTQPHYVIAKDLAFNTLTVSTNKFPTGAGTTNIELSEENWIGESPEGPVMARYRYRQQLIPATLRREGGRTLVTLHEPQYMPEGQSLVLYAGTRCLGGGIIERAWLSSSPNQTVRPSLSMSANS